MVSIHASRATNQERTIEKAATLPKKFDSDTASGVRCLISLIGMTGYGAQ